MVTWYVKEATSECIIYEYFPEDKKDKKPGLITIDRINEKIELKFPAELDFNRTVSEEDARRLCEVIFDNSDEVETEYDYHRFSSNKGDCMNLRVGCTICHSDGSYYLPNCLMHFGYSHDFIDDYA